MQSKRTIGTARARAGRGLLATVVLCGAFAAFASSASAVPRSYVGEIGGLTRPEAVSVNANDNVLVSDVATGALNEYGPFPSQNLIGTQESRGYWGGGTLVHSMARSAANDFLYVATDGPELPGGGSCGGTPFSIFDNFGNLFASHREEEGCETWVAVDNDLQSDAYGHYYYYGNRDGIEQFDGYGNPVNFTGSASYISGNTILKTPFGNLVGGSNNPEMAGITVDSEGNIWVINSENDTSGEIDEFAPSGVFLQRITANSSGAPESTNPIDGETHPFGYYPGLTGIAVDPTSGDVVVSDKFAGVVDEFSPQGKYLGSIDGSDAPTGRFKFGCDEEGGEPPRFCHTHVNGVAFNSEGYLYVATGLNGVVDIYSPRPVQPAIAYKPATTPTATAGTLNATVSPNGGGEIISCQFEYGTTTAYASGSIPCTPDPSGTHFSAPTDVHAEISGLTAETTYHYRVVVGNTNATRVGPDQTYTPHNVVGLRAEAATNVTSSSATLNGSFVGNGADTHYWFEYGTDTSYGTKIPLPAPPGADAGSQTGPSPTALNVDISGLNPVTRYHYRVVAENGSTSRSEDASFRTAPLLPRVEGQNVTEVHSNQAVLSTGVNPGGADTVYTFEYGTEKCSQDPDPCTVAFPNKHVGSNLSFDAGSDGLQGLQPATTYYYRTIATNSAGTVYGADRNFTTYHYLTELKNPCPNALARQQTGSALVTDCRAYELVSAANAGGYDVESDLVPGQMPFEGYPEAENPPRALYGVHSGAIPGIPGNPTNRGVDPYVATRGENGWSSSYVGIPATQDSLSPPFSSTLAEADPALDTFAFGGSEICSPCFADGSTGVPLHLPDGSLVQGMKGSIEPPSPVSSDGLVRKRFSADGSHFVFSSTSQFEPEGNDETGDVSIYDRDLQSGQTQVVSTDHSGNPLSCLQGAGNCHAPGDAAGISELDISGDGSRILIGQKISTDADGNNYYHLYMHVGTSPDTIDLTPGASAGVLYDGMTADGSRVFFTTTDHLLSSDTDASADIYEAAISGDTSTLRLISTKGASPSNDDSCTPPGTPTTWNAVSGAGKCSAVAIAGGAGVATEDGTFYFLSPELLDGSKGEANQPNLYVVKPGGNPEFVATIDTSVDKPVTHPVANASFLNGLHNPESIAVDQSDGDVYVAERGNESVDRYTANGAPDNFTAGPAVGTNKLIGQSLGGQGEGEIAIDNAQSSPSPLAGALYVTSNGGTVSIYASSGEQLGELTGLGKACGVAVDQSNGDVYVGDYSAEAVWRFEPTGSTTPISNADYVKTGIHTEGVSPCPVGTDSHGHVFASGYGGEPVKSYNATEFSAGIPSLAGTAVNASRGNALYGDPSNGDLYVDTGSKIAWLSSAGSVISEFGSGELSSSQGVAIDSASGNVYASSGSKIIKYGPYAPIESPAVVHAVSQSATHDYGDFQVTPSGDFAAFVTRMPLDPSYENLDHAEVYRYDTSSHGLDCVSCSPTNALSVSDASLASGGLSLTNDGRVFFNTTQSLVLRDDDETQDVYEWEQEGVGPEPGKCDAENPNIFPTGVCVSLISSGTSQFDSSLLSTDASGTDVYFFTHDTLAHGDENGPVTKIYDARTDGGFFAVPEPAKCAASDECHGPGTKAAAPPPIGTSGSTPSSKKSQSCKKGFVKKHGKCARKPKPHQKQHPKRGHRRATHRRHG